MFRKHPLDCYVTLGSNNSRKLRREYCVKIYSICNIYICIKNETIKNMMVFTLSIIKITTFQEEKALTTFFCSFLKRAKKNIVVISNAFG